MFTFFHGLIGTNNNWDSISSYFLRYNPDISTCSLSLDYTKPFDEIINDTQTKISHALAKNQNKQNSIAVGNSLGCFISLRLIDKFDKIILTAPPFKFQKGKLLRSKEDIIKSVNELFYNKEILKEHEQELDNIVNLWSNRLKDITFIRRLKKIKMELSKYDFDDFYKTYQSKIHFVLGDKDTISPTAEMSELIRMNYPLAKLDIFPNCGHAVPLEKPEELIKILRKYSGSI